MSATPARNLAGRAFRVRSYGMTVERRNSRLASLQPGFAAVVVGASGGIGAALASALAADPRCAALHELARSTTPSLDVTDEASIAAAAQRIAGETNELRLVIDATGILEIDGAPPEKALAQLDPARLARAFAVNAIGPALLLKHLAPLLARDGKTVFASLSARVGSIGDNRLGGWYGYRASKAALNQVVHTAAIEIARKRPDAVCVALHPGTVATPLSEKFASGHRTVTPDAAAANLLTVIDRLTPADSGGFYAWDGAPIVW